MAVVYPNIITPGQQRVFFAEEPQWGVAPVTSVAGTITGGGTQSVVFLEPCQAVTSAIQRTPFEAREYTGVPADLFDMIETTHHTTITLTVAYRANGIAAHALSALAGSVQGGAQETIAAGAGGAGNFATTSHVHTLIPNVSSNVINTFTIWHDQGDDTGYFSGTRGMLQMSAATVESVRLTFTPNTALMAEITLQALFPLFQNGSGSTATAYTPPSSGVIKLGSSDPTYHGTRMMSYQGVAMGTNNSFNIMSSTGVQYTNKILSGDLTITRQNEVIESPYSQNPTYFLPGEVAVTGSFDFLYDGIGDVTATNPTIFEDYLKFTTLGSLANQNEIRYIDNDGNGFDLQFYPIKWTGFTLNASAQSLKANAQFTSFNSLSAAQTAGTISAMRQIQLANDITWHMVI